jgi:hypothetical protein
MWRGTSAALTTASDSSDRTTTDASRRPRSTSSAASRAPGQTAMRRTTPWPKP